MNAIQWYAYVLKNYMNFKGRASRAEFWGFFFIDLYMCLLAVGISQILVGSESGLLLFHLYFYGRLLPCIGVIIRRLHDINKDGRWVFVAALPVLNFYVLYLMSKTSVSNENLYGESGPTFEAIPKIPLIQKYSKAIIVFMVMFLWLLSVY